ncbi:immunity 51 family protein [Kitasatospora sp. NPDC088351]|uniref:immunity 51 family protein n=1 Tax=unclassified Kitasatospora TaxID=2633591 RepID=UPI00342E329A
MTDRESFAPLTFFEYDHRPGTYCLLLSDGWMPEADDVFEAAGHDAGGYGWEGVARSAIRERAPELAGRISFDSEAGMFVAYGDDADALRALGALLREACRDRALLRELVEAGDPDWFD